MYIKDTILRSLTMANMDPVIIVDQAPLAHPSYATSSEAVIKEERSAAEAEALWKLLIDEFRHRKELNKDAQKEAKAIRNTTQFNALLIKYAIPKPLKPAYQDDFIYFSEKTTNASTIKKQEKTKESYMGFLRGVTRSTNPELKQFAHKLRVLPTIPKNRELALQSGGIDLSAFSYDEGCCPLRQTVLGSLLNNMPIITLRDLETPLWNTISRTFVSQYTWLPVHIYFHILDSASVLLRQEPPLMQRNSVALVIHWHPIFNYPRGMVEISVHGEAIAESGRDIDDMKAVAELLIARLGATSCKASKQACERANSDYFDPTRPPFAVDK